MSPRLLKTLQFEQLTEITTPTAFTRSTPSRMRTHRHQSANYSDLAFRERIGARASRARLLRRRPLPRPAEGAASRRDGAWRRSTLRPGSVAGAAAHSAHASPQRRWVRPRGGGSVWDPWGGQVAVVSRRGVVSILTCPGLGPAPERIGCGRGDTGTSPGLGGRLL